MRSKRSRGQRPFGDAEDWAARGLEKMRSGVGRSDDQAVLNRPQRGPMNRARCNNCWLSAFNSRAFHSAPRGNRRSLPDAALSSDSASPDRSVAV